MFDTSTIPDESPEMTGQEEVGTEEQETQLDGQEYEESDQDAAEYEEETPSEEEQGEEEEQPEFDFATAYSELRKDYTRKTQELSELKKQQQYQPPAQEQAGAEDLNARFIEEFNQDPVGTLLRWNGAITEQNLAPVREQQMAQDYSRNVETLAKNYPELQTEEGYKQFTGTLVEIAQELGNPNLVQNPPARILKMAANEAFGQSKARLYEKAKAKGKEEAMQTIRTKKGLGAPVGAKPKEVPKTAEEQIADSIVSAGRKGGIFG